jgi:hypothetical protein
MSDDSRPNLPPFPLGCRASGLLLHVTSLPSPYGIGDVGPAAIAWIDQLHEAKQSWWQALPLGPGHLPYRKRTFEDYIGVAGRKRLGQKKWEQAVKDVVARLIGALEPEDVVLGGGNVNNLKKLPSGCRAGNNADAFVGGFRLWQKIKRHNRSASRCGKP